MDLKNLKIPPLPTRHRLWTKNKKIVVTRHSDGKKKYFDSPEKAAEELHINVSFIRYVLGNPKHICHFPDQWQPILSNGKLNTKPKPLYDFTYEEDIAVKIISKDELKEVRTYPSHYKCKMENGFSSSTYQLKIRSRSRNNIMKDKFGREWEIIPIIKEEF